MLKHSSSGFTIAELGAGLGVFALAASLMAPMAVSSATSAMTASGETNVTVADTDGRKPITTPPVDAVEVTVVDSNGADVKTVTVNDPSATSTVISGLDPNGTYTFEVAKVNVAGKSAKAAAIVEYKQTGTRNENYTVTVPYTDTASETVGSSAEQVDDTSSPIYVQVDDTSKPKYKTVTEKYEVPVEKTRMVTQTYTYQVDVWKDRWVTETFKYNHVHQNSRDWTHTHRTTSNHTHSSSYNHEHSSNHVHSSNHTHSSTSSYCHYHSRYYTCHRHTRTSYSNHVHYSNHTHYSNHVHTSTYNHVHENVSYHTHTDYWSENHEHTETSRKNYPYTVKEDRTGTRQVAQQYTVMEERTRQVQKFDGYQKKNEFRGYNKKTQYRLCWTNRGHGGVATGSQCQVSSTPASKTVSWTVTKYRDEGRTRTLPVYGHVKQQTVKAEDRKIVFKVANVTNGRVWSSGTVAAVGKDITGVSVGSTKSFFRWSGKTFTFNGEQYIMVDRWALQR